MGTPNYDEIEKDNTYDYQELNFYFADQVNREKANLLLKNQPNGTFLLRNSDSASKSGGTYFAISVVESGEIKHRLICYASGYGKAKIQNATIIEGSYVDYFKNHKTYTNPFTNEDLKQFYEAQKELKKESAAAAVNELINQMQTIPNAIKPPKEICFRIAFFLPHGGNVAPVNKAIAKTVQTKTDETRQKQTNKLNVK